MLAAIIFSVLLPQYILAAKFACRKNISEPLILAIHF